MFVRLLKKYYVVYIAQRSHPTPGSNFESVPLLQAAVAISSSPNLHCDLHCGVLQKLGAVLPLLFRLRSVSFLDLFPLPHPMIRASKPLFLDLRPVSALISLLFLTPRSGHFEAPPLQFEVRLSISLLPLDLSPLPHPAIQQPLVFALRSVTPSLLSRSPLPHPSGPFRYIWHERNKSRPENGVTVIAAEVKTKASTNEALHKPKRRRSEKGMRTQHPLRGGADRPG